MMKRSAADGALFVGVANDDPAALALLARQAAEQS
jgi:hypothetical protein